MRRNNCPPKNAAIDTRADLGGGSQRVDGSTVAGWTLTAALVCVITLSASRAAQPKRDKLAKTGDANARSVAAAGLAPNDSAAFQARFDRELWPIMTRSGSGCIVCHGQKNASQFLLLKDSKSAFLKMLGEDHFDPDNHASIIERVSTTDKTIKMPPVDMTPLTPAEVALFTRFAEDLQKKRQGSGTHTDEQFPAHLLASYAGTRQPEGLDNTFLSYQQLRGKVHAIFGDDWKREGRDLFAENAYMFGGADYIKRFDESTRATPEYLTGVDLLGRDIASRAYLSRTGPFAGFPAALPVSTGKTNPATVTAIRNLYNRMLFRDPSPAEQREALGFLQNVYRAQNQLALTAPQDLRFALTLRDDKGMTTARDVEVRVSANPRALVSEFVDQSKDTFKPDEKAAPRMASARASSFTRLCRPNGDARH